MHVPCPVFVGLLLQERARAVQRGTLALRSGAAVSIFVLWVRASRCTLSGLNSVFL